MSREGVAACSVAAGVLKASVRATTDMCCVVQIANVSSGAGSLAGKVKFVEDAEIRKTLPYATQALAYKQSKVSFCRCFHMCESLPQMRMNVTYLHMIAALHGVALYLALLLRS